MDRHFGGRGEVWRWISHFSCTLSTPYPFHPLPSQPHFQPLTLSTPFQPYPWIGTLVFRGKFGETSMDMDISLLAVNVGTSSSLSYTLILYMPSHHTHPLITHILSSHISHHIISLIAVNVGTSLSLSSHTKPFLPLHTHPLYTFSSHISHHILSRHHTHPLINSLMAVNVGMPSSLSYTLYALYALSSHTPSHQFTHGCQCRYAADREGKVFQQFVLDQALWHQGHWSSVHSQPTLSTYLIHTHYHYTLSTPLLSTYTLNTSHKHFLSLHPNSNTLTLTLTLTP